MRFILEYENQFRGTTAPSANIHGEALRLLELTRLPEMTEEEILQTEIPEGSNHVFVRCMFNGRPSFIRVINNRGQISYNVDYQFDLSVIRERQDSLALLLGRVQLGLCDLS